MKKLILLASLAAAVVGFSACNNNGKNAKNNEGFDTLFTQGQADTLSASVGRVLGYQNYTQFANAMKADSTLSKQKFVQGLRYILDADTTTSYMYGMITGLNILSQVRQWEAQGADIKLTLLYSNFQKCFMADTIDQRKAQAAQEEAMRLTNTLQVAAREYHKAKLQASDESQANIKRGRQYVDSLRQANGDLVVTASGVAYLITNPGEGEKVQPSDRVALSYVGSTIDGREFDKVAAENARPRPQYVLINGLQEVLPQLSKGAKAVVCVPGSEAYGVENNSRYGLGLNELVIYDLEVVDIEK